MPTKKDAMVVEIVVPQNVEPKEGSKTLMLKALEESVKEREREAHVAETRLSEVQDKVQKLNAELAKAKEAELDAREAVDQATLLAEKAVADLCVARAEG